MNKRFKIHVLDTTPNLSPRRRKVCRYDCTQTYLLRAIDQVLGKLLPVVVVVKAAEAFCVFVNRLTQNNATAQSKATQLNATQLNTAQVVKRAIIICNMLQISQYDVYNWCTRILIKVIIVLLISCYLLTVNVLLISLFEAG